MKQYISKTAVLAEIEKEIKCIYAGREYVGIPSNEENIVIGIRKVEDIINSLEVKKAKENPVSKDLEEYSTLIADELPQGTALTPNGEFDIASVRKLIKDACKLGAKWQEMQMKMQENF